MSKTPDTGRNLRPSLLVLENVWSESLEHNISVRPFFEGWANLLQIKVSFRTYHDRDDLKHWLKIFAESATNPDICYIAGHGIGGRLHNPKNSGNINVKHLIKDVFPKRRGPVHDVGKKGILLGACEVGLRVKLEEIINTTGYPLEWIAGYGKSIPWMESTLADLLFLSYIYTGRTNEKSAIQKTIWSPGKLAKAIQNDFNITKDFDFNFCSRKSTQQSGL